MLGFAELALELVPVLTRAFDAGISIAGVVSKLRAGLNATAAPDDPTWQAADDAVNALMARALDPATDNR